MPQDRTKDPQYLGDILKKVLEAAGGKQVAQAVEKVTGKPCGCQERTRKINEWHQRWLAQRATTKDSNP